MTSPGGGHQRLTPEQIVASAWRLAIEEASRLKTSPDPSQVPCPDCGREVDWCAQVCVHCGAAYCDATVRHRARLYEGLLFG